MLLIWIVKLCLSRDCEVLSCPVDDIRFGVGGL